MDRNVTVFNGTEIIEQYQQDYSWDDVRQERDEMLRQSDLWMLTDRYAQLTEEQQTELVEYRQTLRDLPSTYFDDTDDEDETSGANNATDNFPTEPDWMVI